jgi:SCY1-like protein 1
VSSLLLIGKSMGAEEFTKRVVPCISKLFASSDRGLR